MLKPVAAPILLTVILSVALVACQSSTTGNSPPANAATPTPGATSTQTTAPTATLLPLSLPRPTDMVTDGTCESGHGCLGLLQPGTTYQTQAFQPQITFSVPSTGWENLVDIGGIFRLLAISSPGDEIEFFRNPRVTNADGTFAAPGTVSELSTWLAANTLLHVTPAQAVTVGRLKGVTMDITIAAGATSHPAGCPVQTCVDLFSGVAPSGPSSWNWGWGLGGQDAERLYLLTSTDGVIAIFVDSPDGTTFQAMTTAADQIIGTLKFG